MGKKLLRIAHYVTLRLEKYVWADDKDEAVSIAEGSMYVDKDDEFVDDEYFVDEDDYSECKGISEYDILNPEDKPLGGNDETC